MKLDDFDLIGTTMRPSMRSFIAVIFWLFSACLMSVHAAETDEDLLSDAPLSVDSCRCISIIPIGSNAAGRSLYSVRNNCANMAVSVGFAGDIARVSPDLRISSWANAGVVKTNTGRNIFIPEGWTIASIAAYELRDKWGKFECRLGSGLSTKVIQDIKDADEKRKNSLTFHLTSEDPSELGVKFYLSGTNLVWPSDGKIYVLPTKIQKTMSLACKQGQKICYGAWRQQGYSATWGAGRNNSSCTNCCYTCGGGDVSFTLQAGPSGPPPNQIVFDVQSLDRNVVALEFYAADATRAWPGGDQMYPLEDSEFHRFSLNCQQGEKICYGAWRKGDRSKYWGVGRGGREGCEGCCRLCGSGTHRFTLNDGGGSSGVSSSDVVNTLGAILGGVAGVAGAGGYRSPSPTYRAPPQSYRYGPGRAPGQSDISGTH